MSCVRIYPGARMMSQTLSLCIRSYLVPLNRVFAVACQCSLGINGEDLVSSSWCFMRFKPHYSLLMTLDDTVDRSRRRRGWMF